MAIDLEQRYTRIDDGAHRPCLHGQRRLAARRAAAGRLARRDARLRVRQRLELSPDRRRLPPGDSPRRGQRASLARRRGWLPHAAVRVWLRTSRPGGTAPQSSGWRCRLAADDDGAPAVDGRRAGLACCAPVSLAHGAPVDALGAGRGGAGRSCSWSSGALPGVVATRRFARPGRPALSGRAPAARSRLGRRHGAVADAPRRRRAGGARAQHAAARGASAARLS